MFLQLFLYNILFPIFFILYFPFYLKKQLKRGGIDSSFWERFGIFSASKRKKLTQLRAPVWIHAVSVGETVIALTFIEEWQKLNPKINFVLSTTTTTGQAIARKKSNDSTTVIYMPFDFLLPLQNTFRLIKPSKLVIFEVEIWPNLLYLAKKNGVETSLVNGRMSDNSCKGFLKYAWFFKPVFQLFDKICVQTTEDARRFSAASGNKVTPLSCDTMKFDQAPKASGTLSRTFIESRLQPNTEIILIAASTHPGEEDLFLEVYKKLKSEHPGLSLILVPRHVERTKEIEALIESHNLSYSKLTDETKERKDLMLVNVTGELLSLINCSDIVFVGKSLKGNKGGHNIIEPAVFGKAILHGPDMQNFKVVSDIFQKENAALIVTEESLEDDLKLILKDRQFRSDLGGNALSVVQVHSGAVAKTIKKLSRD